MQTKYPLETIGGEPLQSIPFVIITAQGNHYASTFDPAAAKLIQAGPVLLAACRDALELLQDPDAESFDANRVTATLERAIAQAERGGA